MSTFARDITSADFDRIVIQGSKQQPVLVDFWAPWCGPCRALTPVLERLAQEYDGSFVLAKVNSDENPDLAREYSIRSIPNVKAFVDGQLADEFLGALPESAVRDFIDRLMPTPGELMRREAAARVAAGVLDEALELLASAAEKEPNNDAVHAARTKVLLAFARVEEARAAAAQLGPLAARDPDVARALARLQLADTGPDADMNTLEERVRASPDDLETRLRLAKLYAAQQRYEPALEQLLEITRRDRRYGDDAGRKTMLAIFDLLQGEQGELVSRYRRLLASALH